MVVPGGAAGPRPSSGGGAAESVAREEGAGASQRWDAEQSPALAKKQSCGSIINSSTADETESLQRSASS